MKIRFIQNWILAGLCLALGHFAQAAENPVTASLLKGKEKAYTCIGCHSVAGYSNTYPTYHVPRIGGQNKEYIEAALRNYKAGVRQHGSMQGNAVTMSDEDIRDIANYLSVRRFGTDLNPGSPVTGDARAGQRKTATCAGCHGDDGNIENSANPRLAGQYESYLVHALKAYKTGKRNNAVMASMTKDLSDQDILDIAAYYASQKRSLSILE